MGIPESVVNFSLRSSEVAGLDLVSDIVTGNQKIELENGNSKLEIRNSNFAANTCSPPPQKGRAKARPLQSLPKSAISSAPYETRLWRKIRIIDRWRRRYR